MQNSGPQLSGKKTSQTPLKRIIWATFQNITFTLSLTAQKYMEHLGFRQKEGNTSRVMGLKALQFSHSVLSDSSQPHGMKHARPPCPSPTPKIYSNSDPLSWQCHPTISCSVIPFSSCLLYFPASGPFPKSQVFTSGGQSIGVSASASVLPINI